MKLLFAVLPGLLAGIEYHCVEADIRRHISSGEYTYFWIFFDPPDSAPRQVCGGRFGCCAAGFCFEYLKNNWFSFDMLVTFPNNRTRQRTIAYNLGELTNNGPWDYTSTVNTCLV
ncbi:hypothetical protein DSO57_1016313 [Entomophthora muscae]|uniref:Uncharacterized protein n=1 Tax=Entomophthora muscae TaxID=34485 RepID=A0ACC2SUF9_9FUNG|nr:hypothetical protein DSO57_1016313 [Entomophthora muscae]